jgi:hypothetical protein
MESASHGLVTLIACQFLFKTKTISEYKLILYFVYFKFLNVKCHTAIINNYMPVTVTKVDSLQTRLYQSFVNLTKNNSTTYPALTTISIQHPDPSCTNCEGLTAYQIYDQWAIRTASSI